MNINPTQITNFNRSKAELQAFWLFCMFVAGKNSDYASACLTQLLSKAKNELPFDYLKSLGENGVHNALVASKVGQYHRLTKGIIQSFSFCDRLETVTLNELMEVYGVGPKTARFFLLHTRQDSNYAVLDTHILKWLKSKGFTNIPDQTPSKIDRYEDIEETYIFMAKNEFPFLSLAHIDLLLWKKMSGRELDNF